MVETEIKFRLTKSQYDAIRHANYGQGTSVKQVDTYYVPPANGITMRVREEWKTTDSNGLPMLNGRTACLTIKTGGGLSGPGIYSSQEIEPQLPGSSGDVIKQLLQTLNIPQDITVEKLRTEYADEGCKMALDDVKGLGYFMEVEVLGESEAAAHERINEVIARYGFNDLPVAKGGYPSLLKQRIDRF